MVFGVLAKSQKPLINFFQPVINIFLTSDLFSLTTSLNHWFFDRFFHMDAPTVCLERINSIVNREHARRCWVGETSDTEMKKSS